jgi:quinoprotein glucose dehydrogenase
MTAKPALYLALAGLAVGADVDWPINGGPNNIRYSSLTQINKANVSQLKVAWTYDSHDAFKGSEMQSNPIVVDGLLYATTPKLRVIALDAATGREIWSLDPKGKTEGQRRVSASGRHSLS